MQGVSVTPVTLDVQLSDAPAAAGVQHRFDAAVVKVAETPGVDGFESPVDPGHIAQYTAVQRQVRIVVF